jgi:hypothetical protein
LLHKLFGLITPSDDWTNSEIRLLQPQRYRKTIIKYLPLAKIEAGLSNRGFRDVRVEGSPAGELETSTDSVGIAPLYLFALIASFSH